MKLSHLIGTGIIGFITYRWWEGRQDRISGVLALGGDPNTQTWMHNIFDGTKILTPINSNSILQAVDDILGL